MEIVRARTIPLARRARVALGTTVGRVPEAWTWSTHEPNPTDADVLDEFACFAVIGTWMNADVIGGIVTNLFKQGCDRVFVVDNDSPDDTVEVARAAGAEIGAVYTTTEFDDRRRKTEMSQLAHIVSDEQDVDHAWWLFQDADEFFHGPRGLTLREYLATLDRRFRIVGARMFEHFPSTRPQYENGAHPLRFQPLCREHPEMQCRLLHWKHPLVRIDKAPPGFVPTVGFHRTWNKDGLHPIEPDEGVFLHHFPFLAEEATRARTQAVFERRLGKPGELMQDIGSKHWAYRQRVLDVVYSGSLDDLRWPPPHGKRPTRIELKPWADVVDPADARVEVW